MRPVTEARTIDGSTWRKMASEREANEMESRDIFRNNVRQEAQAWNLQRRDIT